MAARTVGIIGLGFGRAHVAGFQAAGCNVVAVCQRDTTAAKALADKYGVPGVFASWEDLLAKAKPDIVVIATPPHLHHAIALRAFGQGAHVVCEKPLAMNRAEADAMVAAAAKAKRVAMTGFNWRFIPAMTRLHAFVGEGGLGRVFHVSGRWFGARWADEAAAATWRMDRSVAGHGAMGDMGVHLVDLVRWNFGEFRRVVAHAGIAYPSKTVPGTTKAADAEDYATVLGELESGAEVTLGVSRAARGANDHTLEAYGAKGALTYRVDRDAPRWWTGQLNATGGGAALAPVKVDDHDATGDPMEIIGRVTIAPLVQRLLEAAERGGPVSPSLDDGLRSQAVLDAVLASLSRGGWVDVAP
jgi:predicted dehydrogenase